MFNLKLLDLSELPSLPLSERANLPNSMGIYFAIDSQGVIQYIGRSNNINRRWKDHHHYSNLKRCNSIKIAWLIVTDNQLLPSIESACIEWFQPSLNCQTRKKNSKEKIVRTTITVPDLVLKKFRVHCKEKRRSISAQITLLMEQELKNKNFGTKLNSEAKAN